MRPVFRKLFTRSSLTDLSRKFSAQSTLSLLRSNDVEVFLIGTAHISAKSEANVRDVIRAVTPKIVMVELCGPRAAALRARGSALELPNLGNPMYQRGFELFSKFAFANGRDMLAALHEADDVGARIVHGDLEQSDTFGGLRSALSSIPGGAMGMMARMARAPRPPDSVVKLATRAQSALMQSSSGDAVDKIVEEFKERKTLREMRNWLDEVSPEIMNVMAHRRDAHMFQVLEGLVLGAKPGTKVVAVVGVAHMDGLEKRWQDRFGAPSVSSLGSSE